MPRLRRPEGFTRAAASLAWRFSRHDAEAVVAGDYRMNSCFGNPTVPCNLRSRPWLDEGIVDNEPALPPVGAGVGSHPVLDFCKGQMGGRHGLLVPCLPSPLVSPCPKDSSIAGGYSDGAPFPWLLCRAVCLPLARTRPRNPGDPLTGTASSGPRPLALSFSAQPGVSLQTQQGRPRNRGGHQGN